MIKKAERSFGSIRDEPNPGGGPLKHSSEKSGVLILGMHRSGTSAAAKVASLMGYAMPRDLMPAQKDNPTGFWEPLSITELNDRILRELGIAWHSPSLWQIGTASPLASGKWVHDRIMQLYLDEAHTALRLSFADETSIVLKDPRFCLLLPLWREVLRQAGYAIRSVVVSRAPIDVVSSLVARERPVHLNRPLAAQLWLRYTLSLLLALEEIGEAGNIGFLPYEALLSNPLASMARALGRDLSAEPVTEAVRKAVDAFVEPTRRHHNGTSVGNNPTDTELVRSTTELLTHWTTMPAESRRAELERLYNTYADFLHLTGQVIETPRSIFRVSRTDFCAAGQMAEGAPPPPPRVEPTRKRAFYGRDGRTFCGRPRCDFALSSLQERRHLRRRSS